ncbi:nucleotidyltransferase domain-containing protein [Metabacillus halosaccharovorans]|uniref:nucleotidyltransferase domain-containing protein n=1 Tax=Metabacillus halosaccharovorans TaxID=930124 RepID=UPI001C1FFA34|nr:nucleotidyltransferase family protein [Metabacillus halosaccharovorans]MBU7593505.1 nucleotidyltransferase family protein [Metabacillus halosaccharovorans]
MGNYTLKTDNVPKELLIILDIIKGNKITTELLIDTDWKLFTQLLIHHRLYPLIYPRLKDYDQSFFPSHILQIISYKYRMNTIEMLKLSGEMIELDSLFTNNEIMSIFLKGPALALEIYGDISLRTSGDLDILVSIDQLESVNVLLCKVGYKKDEYFSTTLDDWKWRHHHLTYYHSEKGIKLEVHWRLNPGPSKEPSFRELWERSSRVSFSGHSIHLLGKEDLFLFLVTHGARHGWSRLRWLVDIHKLINKDVDCPSLINRLKKYDYMRIGGQSIILSNQLLNTSIDKYMTNEIISNCSKKLANEAVFYLERMINLHSEPLPEDVSNFHKKHMFHLLSFRQKLLLILSFLYPYPDDVDVLPLPKRLHFLYFPLRPFLWSWRRVKGLRKQTISS